MCALPPLAPPLAAVCDSATLVSVMVAPCP
jgi:hypothetical protein